MSEDRLRSALGTDPFVAAAERPTGLLAVFWGTGALLTAFWAAFGVDATGMPLLVAAIAAAGALLASVLWWCRRRVFPEGVNAALVLAGTVAVLGVLYGSGRGGGGPPAVLFVYVGAFAFVAIRRPVLSVVLPSVVLHAALLVWLGNPAAVPTVVVVWAAVLVASVLVGSAAATTRRVSAERESLLTELREADETKTAFLHAVGHDLGAPASALVGLAELVKDRDAELAPEVRAEMLERIAANARRLHQDLTGLIRFEELATGRVALRREPVRSDELVRAALDRAGIGAHQVSTRAVSTFVMHGDPAQLEHALANLLANARRYAGHAGPIDVEAATTGTRARLAVADRGPGVPPSERERIFEPLGRARAGDVARGSGIGLSLVRAFARLHDGDAWVEDRRGGGARFVIEVPLRSAESAPG